ncbi:probable tetraacyldisaccharide 4'-kinase, mitochondrial [Phragmites australis]|uniref:probable tetraacyldisaccharide 4'-kinase, mitochondrial n=1 Tax=Phragmites australis TaxID=29695 RepID=UPI002D78C903|nr:probable tetraacyldisaccharide 4'-kinase, mitochondrial [Phragmites australis]
MDDKARQLIARLAAAPDSAVPHLPFLHRALTLPILSAASAVLRLSLLLSSSRFRPRRTLPVPVVSVGNLTWAGNGKTPMVDFLARSFHRLGISPLLLTRGYAGGDEPKMLRRRLSDTSAKIGIGANRAAVASSMLKKYGYIHHSYTFCTEKNHSSTCNLESGKIGVAILDDGMQHWSLLRDVEIVMVNGLTPWGNTHFIPRGPMREPLSALGRADIVVIHNADLASDMQLKAIKSTLEDNGATCSVFYSRLTPSHIFEVNHPLQRLPLNVLNDKIVLCVSAIGCPDAFIHTVREIGPLKIDRLDFSDHHFFNAHDLKIIQETVRNLVDQHNKDTIVLVTEKDYDRDPEALRTLDAKVWVLSSSLQIMPHKEQGQDEFMRRVKEIIAVTGRGKLRTVDGATSC